MRIGYPTPSAVITIAAELFDITEDELLTARRDPFVNYRRATLVAAKEVSKRSYSSLARSFGNDHSTVMHALDIATEEERYWAQIIGQEALLRWATEPSQPTHDMAHRP